MCQVSRAEEDYFLAFESGGYLANLLTQRNRLLAGRHKDRKYLRPCEHVLYEGNLHLDAVLGAVRHGAADRRPGCQDGLGQFLVHNNLADRRYPRSRRANRRGLPEVRVGRAEDDKRIDLLVLLLYSCEDHRRKRPAERPAGVRNDASRYRFRQRLVRRDFIEEFVYLLDARVMLAGVELTGHDRLSGLHFGHLLPCICGTTPVSLLHLTQTDAHYSLLAGEYKYYLDKSVPEGLDCLWRLDGSRALLEAPAV